MAAPDLSVVVVAHGAWSWTERALAALAEHTSVPYEVVLVDNASADATVTEVRARFASVRVLENDGNRGFGPACNQGAAIARAPLLCFLNTDALVEPGWLEPLAAVLSDQVRAAVPCVLELEGEVVQCAGALLGRDGTVLEYGNGWPAGAAEVRFPRAVDFGPAACLVVSREAFEAVGGFDDRYAPAYYEDADLCLGLAARGWRTVYVPESRVRHARHGSGDRTSARALSRRNQERFVARWAAELPGRPPTLHPPAAARSLCARDAVADGRVLCLAAEAPAAGSPLGVALAAVRSSRPWTRVTLVVEGGGDGGWSARGVEVLAGRSRVLAERRFHYDAVFGEGLDEAVRASQPQAAVFAPPPRDVIAALAAAGLAPAA